MLQSSSPEIKENNWHHIAFSYDQNSVNLYIDGVLSATHSNVIVDTNTTSLQNMVLGSNIDGFVDNVKIFDKSLSDREIKHLAFEDNYNLSLSNKVTDLKFNEFKSTPTSLVNDSGNDATVTGDKEYSYGLVDGSKSIVMNNADISLNQSVPLKELSISTWVNLDNLTSGENVIFGNSDVKFYLYNGDIKLKLNNNDISFTDYTSGFISTKGERFNLNFQASNDLDYSPYAAHNNNGIVTTTVNNGNFNNDIISYPNASFYANKLTLSSWVKTNTNGTIFDLGKLNLNINNNRIDVSVDKYTNQEKTYQKFDTNIIVNNINNVVGIVNNKYDGLLIGNNNLSFRLDTNSMTTIMPKLIKFKIPLRNYSPQRFNIKGVVGAAETILIDEDIFFKPNHSFEFNIDKAEIEYDSIEINFEGNGLLKVSNIEVFGDSYVKTNPPISNDPDLLLYLPLTFNSDDISIYNQTISSGSTAVSFGTNGGNFDFPNDPYKYLQTTLTNVGTTFNVTHSVEFTIYDTDYNANGYIFSMGNFGTHQSDLFAHVHDGYLKVHTYGASIPTANVSLNNNQSYHILISSDNRYVNMYLDGQLVTQGQLPGSVTTSFVCIGNAKPSATQGWDGGTGGVGSALCYLKDFKVWNTVRTP